MKTFEGIIARAQRRDSVCVEFRDGNRIELLAGAAVREQAEALLGRRVRFQAQLHESTLSLSSPIFVVGSQFGLQALAGERRQDSTLEAAE